MALSKKIKKSIMSNIITKKRGGPQPGSGRPKKAESEKAIKVAITLSPEHYEATKGARSRLIKEGLKLLFEDIKP